MHPPRVHFYPVLKVGFPLACGLGQGRLRAAQAWRSLQPSLRWPQFSLTFPPRFSPPLSLCEFLTARVSPTAFLHPRVRRAFHPLPSSATAFAARFTHCLSPSPRSPRVSPTAFLHPRVRRAFHPLPFSAPRALQTLKAVLRNLSFASCLFGTNMLKYC